MKGLGEAAATRAHPGGEDHPLEELLFGRIRAAPRLVAPDFAQRNQKPDYAQEQYATKGESDIIHHASFSSLATAIPQIEPRPRSQRIKICRRSRYPRQVRHPKAQT